MVAAREQTVSLNGRPFFMREWGQPGLPRLLMLHGFPEYSGAWADLAQRLAGQFHCIAPDQRGYGQSWSPDGVENYRLSELCADMAALIGDEPLVVLGHDWGASVAYGLAMFYPDLVSKLIIMNGVHPVPYQNALARGGAQTEAAQYIHYLRREGSQDHLAKDDFARMIAMFSANMETSWLDAETQAEYKREWARPGRLKGMINWYRATPLVVGTPGQTTTDLPELPTDRMHVRCPHLLIWGQDDKALLPEATEGLEEYAPDLTRVTIKGANHWLHHQKPDQVARAILDWV